MVTSPQAIKHRQSVADLTLSPHGHKPTALYSLNFVCPHRRRSHYCTAFCPSHLPHPWPHGLVPPRSPFFSFFFFFIFWVQFVSMWVCVCDFERENHRSKICGWFVVLKGKIIDLTFVFRILCLCLWSCLDLCLCLWFWAGKSLIEVCVSDFGLGWVGGDKTRGGLTGRVWG